MHAVIMEASNMWPDPVAAPGGLGALFKPVYHVWGSFQVVSVSNLFEDTAVVLGAFPPRREPMEEVGQWSVVLGAASLW